jgi:hypothetical protein
MSEVPADIMPIFALVVLKAYDFSEASSVVLFLPTSTERPFLRSAPATFDSSFFFILLTTA